MIVRIIKFNGHMPTGWSRKRWPTKVLVDIIKRIKGGKDIEKERLWKKEGVYLL
jgi:hypothetical protein